MAPFMIGATFLRLIEWWLYTGRVAVKFDWDGSFSEHAPWW